MEKQQILLVKAVMEFMMLFHQKILKVNGIIKILIVTCGNCHKDASDHYLTSNHAEAFKSGDKSAPNCITCHKSPITKIAFGDNKVEMKKAQEKLCLSCHLDNDEVRQTNHTLCRLYILHMIKVFMGLLYITKTMVMLQDVLIATHLMQLLKVLIPDQVYLD
ncbi:MAG: hypothetical protein MZV64_66835 [Ignavibacteriales bacterium]|nr:hypothetical protein [Ignavibacteriales bacterium]